MLKLVMKFYKVLCFDQYYPSHICFFYLLLLENTLSIFTAMCQHEERMRSEDGAGENVSHGSEKEKEKHEFEKTLETEQNTIWRRSRVRVKSLRRAWWERIDDRFDNQLEPGGRIRAQSTCTHTHWAKHRTKHQNHIEKHLYSGAGVHCQSASRWLRTAVLPKAARVSRKTRRARRRRACTEETATSDFWLWNKGGWKPFIIMNRDIPVAELTSELWAYSTHGRCVDQEDGRREATERREDSKLWLSRSLRPLAWGWYLEDKRGPRPPVPGKTPSTAVR